MTILNCARRVFAALALVLVLVAGFALAAVSVDTSQSVRQTITSTVGAVDVPCKLFGKLLRICR